ncbi:MAG: prolipoprotein diacylglyceryl transferase family protein, partial [Armatimonadota bacterium]
VTHMLLGVILVLVAKTKWGKKLGVVTCLFLIGYGLFRCVTEIWRDQEYYVGPFSAGQIASFITSLVGVGMFLLPKRPSPEDSPEIAEESA